jgi:hypothetical protein
VLIYDDVPVDESRRDELLEGFQAHYHGGDGRMRAAPEEIDDDDEVEPDPEEAGFTAEGDD